jgi:PAS domain S-box-containing protein
MAPALSSLALRLRRALSSSAPADVDRLGAAEAGSRWEVMFRHSSWGVVVVDPDTTRIMAANPALERMHGYEAGEMVGMLVNDTLAPEVRAAFEEQATLLPADDHVVYETILCRKDGSEFPVLIDAVTVRDAAGAIRHRVGTYLDLTQRRAAEAARDQAQAQFRTVQDASPDSCVLVDVILDDAGAMTDGCIVYANAAACRMIGRAEGSLSGQLLADVFPGADRYDLYAEVFRTGRTRSVTFHHDGIGRWLRVVVVKVGDGVCIIGTDMSEQKAAEVVLRRSHAELEHLVAERTNELEMAREAAEAGSRAKSEFLSRASHELRTPLNSVIGFSAILLKYRGGTLGSSEIGFLERISHNGRHLLALVNDLLDLSKIEAGKIELELSSVSLYDLVQDVRATLESRAADRGLALAVDVGDGAPAASHLPIVTDEQRLRQVLINLVGNAIKYTERGTVTVRVVASDRGRPLRVDVVDTGTGIAPDRIERMFEPFVIGAVRADGGESTGLGLSISRSLCTAMGYRLSATSVVGEGSVFSIHLGPDPIRPLRSLKTASS